MKLSVNIKKQLRDFTLRADFSCEENMISVLGSSGAGKSMLLKCIAGIEKADSGKILLGERVLFDSEKKINLPPQKRKVGYLFQNYAVFPNMTVEENVSCVAKDKSEVFFYLEKLSLTGKEKCFPKNLSGGELQRLALARLLSSEPEVLLFDEPFSALDNHLKTELELMLLSLVEEKKCPSILVTHDRNEAFRLCKKIAVMEKGSLSPLTERNVFFESPSSLAAAKLSGCKNSSSIVWKNSTTAFARDWDMDVHFKNPVEDYEKKKYAAFRAHYFLQGLSAQEENTFSCKVERVVEDTFSFMIYFREGKNFPENASSLSPSLLCWEVPKENWTSVEKAIKEDRLFAKLDALKIMLLEK